MYRDSEQYIIRGIVEWLIKQSTIDGSQAQQQAITVVILDSQHSQESAC